MRMSTKGRLAVAAMIDLALHAPNGPVALASISQRRGVSLSYLEQLFSRLRREGLVESSRGPGGGYTLGRKAAEITVAQIVMAVDEPADDAGQHSQRSGITLELWQQLQTVMFEHMSKIALGDLVQAQLDKGIKIEVPPVRTAIYAGPALQAVHTRAPNSVFTLAGSMAA